MERGTKLLKTKTARGSRETMFRLMIDGVIVGTIHKPRDTRTERCAWVANWIATFDADGMAETEHLGNFFVRDEAVAAIVARDLRRTPAERADYAELEAGIRLLEAFTT